jgi:anti-anti-sigma factor
MARHLTTPTMSIDTQDARADVDVGADANANANESVWTHTLILTGELTQRSAHALESEIERLYERGVARVTLDLRQLAYIDSIGVAVISFCCGLWRRRGYGLALVPGSRPVQRAFEREGVIATLPFENDEVNARRLRASALALHARDGRDGRER